MSMRLRPALPEDAALLRRWDDAPHLAGTGGDPEFNAWDWEAELGRSPSWRELLIAEIDADAGRRPVGFVQIIDPAEEESRYWGEDCPRDLRAVDLWLGEPGDLGRGLGRRLLDLAVARCFADPAVTAVLVDPMADNLRAHRLYEAAGFRLVGPRRFGPDDCLVYRLERARWRRSP